MFGDSALAYGGTDEENEEARKYFKRSQIPLINLYNIVQYILY